MNELIILAGMENLIKINVFFGIIGPDYSQKSWENIRVAQF